MMHNIQTLMCSEKESPSKLRVCYLVLNRNLSDEWLCFVCMFYTCGFVVVFNILCIVYFIDLTF